MLRDFLHYPATFSKLDHRLVFIGATDYNTPPTNHRPIRFPPRHLVESINQAMENPIPQEADFSNHDSEADGSASEMISSIEATAGPEPSSPTHELTRSASQWSLTTAVDSEADMAILTPTATNRSSTPTDEAANRHHTVSSFPTRDERNHVGMDYSGQTNTATMIGQMHFSGSGSQRFGANGLSTTHGLPPGTYEAVYCNGDGTWYTQNGAARFAGRNGLSLTSNYGGRVGRATAVDDSTNSAQFFSSTFNFSSATDHERASSSISPSPQTYINQNFSSANLRSGSTYIDCRLSSCNGSILTLRDCTISSCNLSDSQITGGNCNSCNLEDCALSGCTLSSCNVKGGRLSACKHHSSNFH